MNLPVALTFAGGTFGNALYVVNQGDNSVVAIDPAAGTGQPFSVLDGGPTPTLLTTIVYDARGQFDGMLYVGDQGSNGDFDSRLYRLTHTGELTLFASAGAGFDDIFGLAFTPDLSGWASGLLVAGDTDCATTDQWGLVDADGGVTTFSALAGVEGIAVDPTSLYGAAVLASRPASGGYSGDDTVTRVASDGGSLGAVVSGIAGHPRGGDGTARAVPRQGVRGELVAGPHLRPRARRRHHRRCERPLAHQLRRQHPRLLPRREGDDGRRPLRQPHRLHRRTLSWRSAANRRPALTASGRCAAPPRR